MRIFAVVLALALAPAARVSAHGALHPRHGELRVFPDRLSIALFVEVPRDEATGLRRLFDRDRNGRLDGDEPRVLTGYLAERARRRLALRRDDRPVPLVQQAEVNGLDDPKASFLVHLTLSAATGPGRYVLEDGGDTAGHLPVAVVAQGVSVRVGAPVAGRSPEGDAVYELPASKAIPVEITRK